MVVYPALDAVTRSADRRVWLPPSWRSSGGERRAAGAVLTATTPETDQEDSGGQSLSWPQRRFLTLLGVPALGITFAVTILSTYAPVLIHASSGPLVVGLLVGGEGLFALFMPPVIGTWSDRASRTVGGRLRIMWIAAPVGALALVGLGVVPGLVGIAIAIAIYYLAHFSYLPPFEALYPDLVPERMSGRSRSFESGWRLSGAGLALILGGFLLAAWKPLPFLLAAALIAGATIAFSVGLREKRDDEVSTSDRKVADVVGTFRELLRDPAIARLTIANAFWNFTLAGMRAFVVLFFTVGLGRSTSFVSGVIFPLVALGLAASVPFAGKFADKFGHVPVLTGACWVYGVGLLIPGFTHAAPVLIVVPIVAAAAAIVMTLPFSALMRLMPAEQHGSASGLFGFARGVGCLFGPLVAGAAIEGMSGVLGSTKGYAAMWFVIGASVLASIPVLRRVHIDDDAR